MRVALFLASVSLLTVLAAPALASHPCTSGTTLVTTRFVVVGAFTGNCAGAYAGERVFDCFQVEWGLLTSVAGVGGHSGCSAVVYVSPGGAGEVCERVCAVLA
jgi:hypothetical protein